MADPDMHDNAADARETADPGARDLLADIAAERVRAATDAAPALYRAELGDHWNAAVHPFGGVVSALALRAARDELARPEHTPRTLTTLFSSPVRSGALDVEVLTLRSGRGMSQLQVTVRNAGSDEPGHRTLALFGGERAGPDFTDARPPQIPAALDCAPPPKPRRTSTRFARASSISSKCALTT